MKSRLYKILSIILSISMIFSVCGVSAFATDTSTEIAYYVLNGAADGNDGKTKDTPVATVYKAIEAMNADGYGEGDSVNIYIMQRSDWNVAEDGTTVENNITAWTAYGTKDLPAHTAEIVVQAYDASVKTYLAFHDATYKNQSLYLGGPTVFKNITLVSPYSDWVGIVADGNSLTYGSGTYFSRMTSANWNGTLEASFPALYTVLDNNVSKETYTKPQNFTIETEKYDSGTGTNRSIHISGMGAAKPTYKEDVTLTFNNSNLKPKLYWGSTNQYAGTTFEKNFNINVKSAATLTNVQGAVALTINGGLQYIVNSDTAVTGDVSTFTNITATLGKWFITNASDYSDLLSFTETAGTYTVKSGYEAVATNAAGDEYYSSNGVLTIPAGIYTVKEYIPPKTGNYYVKNGGVGDGRSSNNPANTVYDVIGSINADGYGDGDSVNIYIMQRSDWNVAEDGTTVENNITAWTEYGTKDLPAHTAEIVVQAYDASVKTYLAFHDATYQNQSMYLAGPTVFKNITLVSPYSDWAGIIADGNSLTYGSGTYFSKIGSSSWDGKLEASFPALYTVLDNNASKETYTKPQNFTIETEKYDSGTGTNRSIHISGKGAAKPTYKEDVTLTFNNSNLKPKLYWGSTNQYAGTTFEKNLNINVKSATALTNVQGSVALTINGGLQYIVNSNTAVTGDVSAFTNITATLGKWFITNASGYSDLITLTSTAGKYGIKTGYIATATNVESGAITESQNGILTLAAGSYTITATKVPITMDYYVKNGGTGDGRSADTPAATVYDVIKSINDDGLIAGDIANIYIMQRSDWNASKGELVGTTSGTPTHEMTAWAVDGGAIPAHTAEIVVQAYDTAIDTYLTFTDKLGQNKPMILSGPTTFKNIRLVSTRGVYTRIDINHQQVVFGEGTTYGYVSNADTSPDSAWSGEIVSCKALATSMGNYGASATVDNEVNITYENEYASTNGNSSIYVSTSGYETAVYKEDVNLVFNNPALAPNIYWGGSHATAGSTTFNKNFNIEVKSGKGLVNVQNSRPVTIEGALQIVVNSGATYGGDVTTFSNVTVNGGTWVVKVSSVLDNALSITNTAGKFAVLEGYTAIATNDSTNDIVLSSDGYLTLDAGQYTVEVVDYYTNDGETVTVYNNVEIDTAELEHNLKDGKVFVGWMKDGTYVDQIATYEHGDILTAQYIDFDQSNFVIEESQIRTDGELGLRFVISYNKQAVATIPNVSKYGTITLPLDLSEGRELFLDTPVTMTWTWDEADKNNFSPDKTGETPIEVVATNILEESDTNVKYTLCITGIEADKYNMAYAARGYIQFTDYNGNLSEVYTTNEQNSLYKLASEALANGENSEIYNDIVEYVEGTWTTNYLANDGAISEYLTGVADSYDTDPNHLMYRLNNGLVVRDVTVDSGISSDALEICFMADNHFNYINEYDIATRSINAMSTYRGRGWLGDGSSITRSIKAMKYASTFDKTVVGGDLLDYLSWGTQSVAENVITKQSINNSVLMAFGNHETEETMQADIAGLEYLMTREERYNRLQSTWTNDVYYHEEILNDKIMLIVMDNSRDCYWENQVEPLKASIAEAREKGLKILLFQHIPMLTMNPNETAVHIIEGVNNDEFATTTNYSSIRDMTSHHGYLGASDNDEVSLEVCKIIRQSSDVISGVFNGHEHANIYTEIVALDENGDVLYENGEMVVIPQHTVAGAHYGTVMKITVE